MAGMFNKGNEQPSFSFDNDEAFKYLGDETKREDYLKTLTGQEAPTKELIAQLKSLDESELRQAVRQLPNDEDRKEMLEAYYNV